jgi:N-acetylglucosaminyldiphosphoundecaprenol N-acetyl-beta-D-mannosaminyltransferase
VVLHGVGFDLVTSEDVVRHVTREIADGRGGRIITPNVDIVRQVRTSPEARDHIYLSSLVVADGAPLVWASRIAGQPLPGRVAGSDLIWTLSGALASQRRSIYLLGGEPGAATGAADRLLQTYPGLRVAGLESPAFGFDHRPDEYDAVCERARAAAPDMVFVGLGFPKQERVIARLSAMMPSTWFMGCGAAIGFVAGTHRRAPRWMQKSGVEWLHRLGSEPRRLAERYLVHDLPFAVRLLSSSTWIRLRRAPGRPDEPRMENA